MARGWQPWRIPAGWRRVVWDSFDRADSALTLGSAETGQAWSTGNQGDGGPLPVWGVSSNQGYVVTASGVDAHVWLESGVADGVVDCAIKLAASFAVDRFAGLLFRRVDASNYFAVRFQETTRQLHVLRCLASVRSTVASSAPLAVSAGETLPLRLVLRGSTILVWANGVGVITYTDANMAAGTKHGLYEYGVGTPRFDNFRVLGRR